MNWISWMIFVKGRNKNIFSIYKGIVPKGAILFFENYLVFNFFPYIFENVGRVIITYKRNFENQFGFLNFNLYFSPEKKIEILKNNYYGKEFFCTQERQGRN